MSAARPRPTRCTSTPDSTKKGPGIHQHAGPGSPQERTDRMRTLQTTADRPTRPARHLLDLALVASVVLATHAIPAGMTSLLGFTP